MSRESNMRQFAEGAEKVMRETWDRICSKCPEMMDWANNATMHDHIIDACGDIFPDLIEQAHRADESGYSDHKENLDRDKEVYAHA